MELHHRDCVRLLLQFDQMLDLSIRKQEISNMALGLKDQVSFLLLGGNTNVNGNIGFHLSFWFINVDHTRNNMVHTFDTIFDDREISTFSRQETSKELHKLLR